MRYLVFILILLTSKLSYSQLEEFHLFNELARNSGAKTILEFSINRNTQKRTKEFILEYDSSGTLNLLEEYECPAPGVLLVMKQEPRYNIDNQMSAVYVTAPNGFSMKDSLFYDYDGNLYKKERYVNNELIRTWNYRVNSIDRSEDRFNEQGKPLRKNLKNGHFIINEYDKEGNLIIITEYDEADKPYIKTSYIYKSKNILSEKNVLLLYLDRTQPLKYIYEYSFW